ncbi:MAG TPA: aminopeptidase N [Pseudomonadales bacterium]|nr:aminopeptidase N [Pseudomonadales bacterium]
MKDSQPKAIRLAEYRPPDHVITDTRLEFDLTDGVTQVTSQLQVRRMGTTSTLRLDGQELELVSVAVDGRLLTSNEYQTDDDSLTLFDLPESCELTIVTRIHPEQNVALEGLYKSGGRSGGMYCTQCEAEGFRKITYYLDRPDVLSKFTTTIIADPAYPVLLSNGNLIEEHQRADGRRSVTWQDPFPKPSYLFALVAGDLALLRDEFVTASGRRVELRIYSEPHNISQCDYAMGALKRAMRWDEEVYGREYDLDIFMIVAVEDFNMGAMENKGLNIFNTSCVLASPDTATDLAYQHVEAVVAHEYFHNWSGNRVTCRDWFQLSLKEGFTVFRDAEFSSDMNSRTVKRIDDVNQLRTVQFAEDAGPLAHPVRPDTYIEISNFYTTTVYEKGAEVVGMIHTLLGPERFRRGTDLYFQRHDGAAVTTEDFVRAMEDANGFDLGQFRRWYSQAGTPVIAVTTRFENGAFDVSIAQRCPPTPGQPSKAPFHIPVAIGLLDRNGNELLGKAGSGSGAVVQSGARVENPRGDGTLIVHVTQPTTQLRVTGLKERPVLSVLRGFSAPVRVEFARPSEELTFLARYDTDGFSRWDAMQSLHAGTIEQIRGGATDAAHKLLPLYRELLNDALGADDPERTAMFAAMLAVPSENYLGELMSEIDVDGLHRARGALRTVLGGELFDEWMAVYRRSTALGPYLPDSRSVGRRALRNLALGFLCATGRSRVSDLRRVLLAQYRDADNLTDRLASLREIVNAEWLDDAARSETIADFYARCSTQKLVIDQWFSVQAACPRAGALARVELLESHADFDGRNPNRLRALYGAFAGQNPVSFHARDGSGYRFLAERVARIDRSNPQIAARLLAPLTRWRRYDAGRRAAMKEALRGIEASDAISRDVYEVVTKTLQGEG